MDAFPHLQLEASLQPITRTVLRISLTITPAFEWRVRIAGLFMGRLQVGFAWGVRLSVDTDLWIAQHIPLLFPLPFPLTHRRRRPTAPGCGSGCGSRTPPASTSTTLSRGC